MKTPILFFLMLLCTGLACKDKLDKSCASNFLEADVNNIPWQATEVSALNSGPSGHVTVIAKADFGTVREISIQASGDVVPGTYALQTGVFTSSILVFPGGFQAESGQLIISVHEPASRVIKGTFSFGIPSENLQVLNGQFCATY
jgi:hypothetical protein